jgi:hypothetical protein
LRKIREKELTLLHKDNIHKKRRSFERRFEIIMKEKAG